jgi:RND family efflux transporter MFP subunit
MTIMKHNILLLLLAGFFLASCGSAKKDDAGDLNDKKAKLQKLKNEQKELAAEITALEATIAKADPSSVTSNAKLVTVMSLSNQDFNHFIELQGKIEAENIAYVTPRGGPGQVRAIYVKKGDAVRKGQLLLKLDDALVRSQIAQVQSQVTYARDLYNRQQNLWKEGIGTEVQVLTARNNVTSLERQISTLKEQQSFSNVYAEISGIADDVNIKLGETFTGSPMQGIRIVNTASLKISANIPENYVTRVKRGTPVEIIVPDLNNRVINSSISLISQTIDPNTRGFIAEAKVPYDGSLKPNQVAQMKILDYSAKNVVAVPVNVVQTDEKGKYVYIMEKEGEKMVARKKAVIIGESYGNTIEIKSGLTGGEQLITEGFQNLYEGQVVTVVGK